MLGLTVLITLALLFLATGSVLLPLKAVLLNTLGLAAVLGAMAWVFHDGHLSGQLDFTPSPVAITMPVRAGLGESGPIISAAAGLPAVPFFAIGLSGVSMVKFFGLGTGIAIVLDALVIRGVLVPVFFRWAGHWAWHAPEPLKRLSSRFGTITAH